MVSVVLISEVFLERCFLLPLCGVAGFIFYSTLDKARPDREQFSHISSTEWARETGLLLFGPSWSPSFKIGELEPQQSS